MNALVPEEKDSESSTLSGSYASVEVSASRKLETSLWVKRPLMTNQVEYLVWILIRKLIMKDFVILLWNYFF